MLNLLGGLPLGPKGASRQITSLVGDEEAFTEQAHCPELGGRFRRSLAGPREPVDALAKLALGPPEDVEAGRELQRRLGIDRDEAFERDASVVLDATEHLEVWPFRPSERRPGFAYWRIVSSN